MVERARFREARERLEARAASDDATGSPMLRSQGKRLRLLTLVGLGAASEVWLAERTGLLPERVILKIARPSAAQGRLAAEAAILEKLQMSTARGAAWFTTHLPQPVVCGQIDGFQGQKREFLLLRPAVGYWGSLAEVLRNAPGGVDPRHAVWIWRRVLETLAFVHESGWTHGDLSPEHFLVHPRDHGVRVIGWSAARNVADPSAVTRDLQQAAWTIRMLLSGDGDVPLMRPDVPPPLATLLRIASEDRSACTRWGATGLDHELVVAARESFGPPRFVPFDPLFPGTTD